ncbi:MULTISPECIES: DNA alkylation repair protein [Bacillaceae]|uniref:DNA alkylation repair protein n=1 Tax=Evansella alkalicola TaxID=745819 RepID=A0ABS6K0U7_9BACI|nr:MULTISPECIES: DNA alkylation repair protein [Bacillaceae]MBU9724285.1 DNA alkylation repair protein [Bacillus alkalicola]
MSYTEELEALFSAHKVEENIPTMKAYMKNQFEFLGIKTPERNALLKQFFKETSILEEKVLPIAFLQEVWKKPEREYQYVVLGILGHRPQWLHANEVPFLIDLIVTKSWWDTVDTIAGGIVGELFSREPQFIEQYIPDWEQHENLWLRRTAILFQLKYKGNTDQDLLFHVIKVNKDQTDFFIRKGIGWALREYSKTNPAAVEAFISENDDLSPLSIREGLKHIKRERDKKNY